MSPSCSWNRGSLCSTEGVTKPGTNLRVRILLVLKVLISWEHSKDQPQTNDHSQPSWKSLRGRQEGFQKQQSWMWPWSWQGPMGTGRVQAEGQARGVPWCKDSGVAKGGAQLLPGLGTHRVRLEVQGSLELNGAVVPSYAPVWHFPRSPWLPPPVPPGLTCYVQNAGHASTHTITCWQLHLSLHSQGSGAWAITPSVVLPVRCTPMTNPGSVGKVQPQKGRGLKDKSNFWKSPKSAHGLWWGHHSSCSSTRGSQQPWGLCLVNVQQSPEPALAPPASCTGAPGRSQGVPSLPTIICGLRGAAGPRTPTTGNQAPLVLLHSLLFPSLY